MGSRILLVVVLVPLAIVLVALAVANRAIAPFTIDPFRPGNPALTVEWPLFVYLFLALLLGVVIGSTVTWFRQGRYRRLSREHKKEADKLRQAPPTTAAPRLSQPSS